MLRTLSVLCFLLPLACSAHAEWSYLGPLPAGGGAYVDLAYRSKDADRGRLRMLANYDAPHTESNGAAIRSSTSIQEFDCPGRRAHLVERRTYEGPFTQGASRTTPLREDPWKDVPRGSRGEGLMALACVATPLIESPTRDWPTQPLVPGSQTLRYDPSHTHLEGRRLSLRWLMEEAPAHVKAPAGYEAKSTEAEMAIDCDKQLILSTTGLGRAAAQGRGAAVIVSPVTQEIALDNGLPDALASLARKLCTPR